MDNFLKDTVVKSIRFDKELADKIQCLAEANQRDFTKQVRFMLIKYLDILDQKD